MHAARAERSNPSAMLSRSLVLNTFACAAVSVCLAFCAMLYDGIHNPAHTESGRFHRNWTVYARDLLKGFASKSRYGCVFIRGSEADASTFMIRMNRNVQRTDCPWYVVIPDDASPTAFSGFERGVTIMAFEKFEEVGRATFETLDAINSQEFLRFAVMNGLV